MKKTILRITALLCVAVVMAALAACSAKEEKNLESTVTADDITLSLEVVDARDLDEEDYLTEEEILEGKTVLNEGEVALALSIQNYTRHPLNTVRAEIVLPDGVTARGSNLVKTYPVIVAGAAGTNTIFLSADPAEEQGSNILLWIVIGAVAAGLFAVAGILLVLRGKKIGKIAVMLLLVALLIVSASPTTVFAADGEQTVELGKTITVGDKTVTVEATVTYTVNTASTSEIIEHEVISREDLTRADLEEALVEVAWDYYLKKGYVQYDSTELNVTGAVGTETPLSKAYGGAWRTNTFSSLEDANEDAIVYSVCSDYCWNVYNEALEYPILGNRINAVTIGMFRLAEHPQDMVVMRWYDDGVPQVKNDLWTKYGNTKEDFLTADKAVEFLENWEENLRPCDIIVARGNGGHQHAMMYVGNGQILHCGGGKLDLETYVDKTEPDGAVQYATVQGTFIEGTEQKGYFRIGGGNISDENENGAWLIVLRPLDVLTENDEDQDLGNDKLDLDYELDVGQLEIELANNDLNPVKTSDYGIPDATWTRMQYPGISISRTVDIHNHTTAVKGGLLTYEIEITNNSSESYFAAYHTTGKDALYMGQAYINLPIQETIPQNTKLVSVTRDGVVNEDGTISWNVNVPLGESLTVRYTVEVTGEIGDRIINDGGSVGRIPSNTIATIIGGEKINEEDQAKMQKFFEDGATAWNSNDHYKITADPDKGLTFVERIYEEMVGVKLELPDVQEIADIFFTQGKLYQPYGLHISHDQELTRYMYTLNDRDEVAPENQIYYDMLVEGYYGGIWVYSNDYNNEPRVIEMRTDHFEPGDILVNIQLRDSISGGLEYEDRPITGWQVLVCLGNGRFASLDYQGKMRGISDTWAIYPSFGQDLFVMLRPSQAYENIYKDLPAFVGPAADLTEEDAMNIYLVEPSNILLNDEAIKRLQKLTSKGVTKEGWQALNLGYVGEVYSAIGLDIYTDGIEDATYATVVKACFEDDTNSSDPLAEVYEHLYKKANAPLDGGEALYEMLMYYGGPIYQDPEPLLSLDQLYPGDAVLLGRRNISAYMAAVYQGNGKFLVVTQEKEDVTSGSQVKAWYQLTIQSDEELAAWLAEPINEEVSEHYLYEGYVVLRPSRAFDDINKMVLRDIREGELTSKEKNIIANLDIDTWLEDKRPLAVPKFPVWAYKQAHIDVSRYFNEETSVTKVFYGIFKKVEDYGFVPMKGDDEGYNKYFADMLVEDCYGGKQFHVKDRKILAYEDLQVGDILLSAKSDGNGSYIYWVALYQGHNEWLVSETPSSGYGKVSVKRNIIFGTDMSKDWLYYFVLRPERLANGIQSVKSADDRDLAEHVLAEEEQQKLANWTTDKTAQLEAFAANAYGNANVDVTQYLDLNVNNTRKELFTNSGLLIAGDTKYHKMLVPGYYGGSKNAATAVPTGKTFKPEDLKIGDIFCGFMNDKCCGSWQNVIGIYQGNGKFIVSKISCENHTGIYTDAYGKTKTTGTIWGNLDQMNDAYMYYYVLRPERVAGNYVQNLVLSSTALELRTGKEAELTFTVNPATADLPGYYGGNRYSENAGEDGMALNPADLQVGDLFIAAQEANCAKADAKWVYITGLYIGDGKFRISENHSHTGGEACNKVYIDQYNVTAKTKVWGDEEDLKAYRYYFVLRPVTDRALTDAEIQALKNFVPSGTPTAGAYAKAAYRAAGIDLTPVLGSDSFFNMQGKLFDTATGLLLAEDKRDANYYKMLLHAPAQWTSSNPKVATVDQNGKVTALKEGEATIRVTFGGCYAECKVSVFYARDIKDGKLTTAEKKAITAYTTDKAVHLHTFAKNVYRSAGIDVTDVLTVNVNHTRKIIINEDGTLKPGANDTYQMLVPGYHGGKRNAATDEATGKTFVPADFQVGDLFCAFLNDKCSHGSWQNLIGLYQGNGKFLVVYNSCAECGGVYTDTYGKSVAKGKTSIWSADVKKLNNAFMYYYVLRPERLALRDITEGVLTAAEMAALKTYTPEKASALAVIATGAYGHAGVDVTDAFGNLGVNDVRKQIIAENGTLLDGDTAYHKMLMPGYYGGSKHSTGKTFVPDDFKVGDVFCAFLRTKCGHEKSAWQNIIGIYQGDGKFTIVHNGCSECTKIYTDTYGAALTNGHATVWAENVKDLNNAFMYYFVLRPERLAKNATQGLTVSKSDLSLYVGDTDLLTVTVDPANAAVSGKWTTSDSAVATVDKNGKVTAVAPGAAVVSYVYDGYRASCRVEVKLKTRPITDGALTADEIAALKTYVPGDSFTAGAFAKDAYLAACIDLTSVLGSDSFFNMQGKLFDTATGLLLDESKRDATYYQMLLPGYYGGKRYSANAGVDGKTFQPEDLKVGDLFIAAQEAACTVSGQRWVYITGMYIGDGKFVISENHSHTDGASCNKNYVDAYGQAETKVWGDAAAMKGYRYYFVLRPERMASNAIQSVSLNKTVLSLVEGETDTLTVTVAPANAVAPFNTAWVSSNVAVATVDANGRITAVAPGTATVTYICDGYKASCQVEVKSATRTITSGALTADEAEALKAYVPSEPFTAGAFAKEAYLAAGIDLTSVLGSDSFFNMQGKLFDTTTGLLLDESKRDATYYQMLLPGYYGGKRYSANAGVDGKVLKPENLKVGDLFIAAQDAACTVSGQRWVYITGLYIGDGKFVISESHSAADCTDCKTTYIDEYGKTGTKVWGDAAAMKGYRYYFVLRPELLAADAVRGVSIAQTQLKVETGKTLALSLVTTPADAAAPISVKWSTSDPAVATVDQNGVVTGIARGKVTITVYCDGFKATCQVAVKAPTRLITDGALDELDVADLKNYVPSEPFTAGAFAKEAYMEAGIDLQPVLGSDSFFNMQGKLFDTTTGLLLDESKRDATYYQMLLPGYYGGKRYSANAGVDGKVLKPENLKVGDLFIAAQDAACTVSGQRWVYITGLYIGDGKFVISESHSAADCTNCKTTYIDEYGKTGTKVWGDAAAMKGYRYYFVIRPELLAADALKGVSIRQTALTVVKGGTGDLTLVKNPTNAVDPIDPKWISSNTAVVTVDETGKVTAVAAGTATVTFTCDGYSASCTVTVPAAAREMSSGKLTTGELNALKAYTGADSATFADLAKKAYAAAGIDISGVFGKLGFNDLAEKLFYVKTSPKDYSLKPASAQDATFAKMLVAGYHGGSKTTVRTFQPEDFQVGDLFFGARPCHTSNTKWLYVAAIYQGDGKFLVYEMHPAGCVATCQALVEDVYGATGYTAVWGDATAMGAYTHYFVLRPQNLAN